jgi:hypothetical protein
MEITVRDCKNHADRETWPEDYMSDFDVKYCKKKNFGDI